MLGRQGFWRRLEVDFLRFRLIVALSCRHLRARDLKSGAYLAPERVLLLSSLLDLLLALLLLLFVLKLFFLSLLNRLFLTNDLLDSHGVWWRVSVRDSWPLGQCRLVYLDVHLQLFWLDLISLLDLLIVSHFQLHLLLDLDTDVVSLLRLHGFVV